MTIIHCGKQTKLSKTMGLPIRSRHNGRNNKFTVPFTESRGALNLLDKLLFPLFFPPLPPAEEGNMQSD